MHRGAAPERRVLPEYGISLGRTVGYRMNGAVSNLAVTAASMGVLGHELRNGGYDVVHVHEPNVPVVSWFAVEASRVPTVGTFHTYSTSRVVNGIAANLVGARRLYGKLSARIAVSEAAAWTARRYYGGRYGIVPNGVDLAAARPGHTPGGDLEILFIGRAEDRKGLPILLRAFEALRGAGIGARLTIAGVPAQEVEPLLLDSEGVTMAGRVSEEEKWRLLGSVDVLCAPSLGGESFGMVLTEAFASGTPVVASDIAGYRDVVRNGEDGILVPAGDPVELGEALGALASDPARRERMAVAARERAERFAWPRVAAEVVDVYERAVAVPRPEGLARVALRAGLTAAEPGPRVGPQRLPSLEPKGPSSGRRKAAQLGRRAVIVAGALAGAGLTVLALERLGIESVGRALVAATPVWVLVAFMLMCLSMLVRAEAWNAILRAALPGTRVRRRDTARATMVGVLMSATLPARLGEPSRALIVARRLGRMRDRFPVVLGTLVSQTLLNILALCVLGTVMFATVGVFSRGEDALVIATIAPVVLLALVISAPWILRSGKPSRFQRVQQAAAVARRAMLQVRTGLQVFRRPRLGAWAVSMQLSAWAIQWLACYVLLVALGLDHQAGIGAAAAVLFAVNVTAALPATPSNLGVFQAACVAVLSAYGVSKTNAFAYGIILQAVEIATALAMGMPALVREGMTWKDLRLRALHAAPVELRSVGRHADADAAEA
jgi:phosphatidylinositol alpha-mannosyltransferase